MGKVEKPAAQQIESSTFQRIYSESQQVVSKNFINDTCGILRVKYGRKFIQSNTREKLIQFTQEVKKFFTYEFMYLEAKEKVENEKGDMVSIRTQQKLPIGHVRKECLDEYINFVLSKRGDENKNIMKKIMCDDGKGFLKVSICLIPLEESIEKSQSEPDIETLPISSNDEIQPQKTRRSQRFIELGMFSCSLMKHILINNIMRIKTLITL